MNKLISAGGALTLVLVGFCLLKFPLESLTPQVYALVAFALLLEFSAVHLSTLGFVSASFPVFFLLCFLPTSGPTIAVLGMLVVLILRSLLRGRADWRAVGFEFLVDSCSVSAALLAGGLLAEASVLKVEGLSVSLLALVSSLVIYWLMQVKLYNFALAQFKLPGELYSAQSEAMSIQARASAMCAPALLLLVLQNPWFILWTLPVFLALYQSNWERFSELRKARAEKTEAKVESVRKDKVLLEAAKNMASLQSQKRLVESCASSFAKTTSAAESFEALVKIFRSLVFLESAAVLIFREQQLVPFFCEGPYAQKFFEQSKAGVRENIMHKAWNSGEVQRFKPSDNRARIFDREVHAAAFPLHGQGVLYIGSSSRPFEGEDFQRLATVAYQFSLSLQSTLREEALSATVKDVVEANRQIEIGRERLLKLLQGSHKMTQKLEVGPILEEASRTLEEIFRPDFLLLRVFNYGDRQQGSVPPAELLESATQKLSGGDLTYYLEAAEFNGQTVGFTGHQLSWEGRLLGFILMASRHQHHFQPVQRRFLELLALHCSVMLTNSKLFSDVQQARKDLEESQAQLVQSSKLAAVGQLAAGVAHELNTPLGAVLLSLQAANRQLRKGRYEKVQDKLDDGVKGAKTAKEIVSKLLFYSREGRVDSAEVSLGAIVTDTIQFLGSQIADENIKLTKKVAQDCLVEGNQNELQQILTNFLVNGRDAILAADKDGGSIEIELLAANGEARLSVTDSGTGFAEEVKERAFEPFYTTKPVGQGTGLGLHVSRQIAERHGGRIEMTSELGQGATLTLVLPLLKGGGE